MIRVHSSKQVEQADGGYLEQKAIFMKLSFRAFMKKGRENLYSSSITNLVIGSSKVVLECLEMRPTFAYSMTPPNSTTSTKTGDQETFNSSNTCAFAFSILYFKGI